MNIKYNYNVLYAITFKIVVITHNVIYILLTKKDFYLVVYAITNLFGTDGM